MITADLARRVFAGLHGHRSGSVLVLLGGAAAAGIACSSCSVSKAETAATTPASEVNPGKPGLGNAQVAVGIVGEHDVGKTIVSSARVAFDEQKVAHIFSPVTGRVTQIKAQLGEHVHKGQTLATILSPDLGNALSDMNKAKPDVIAAEHELKRQQELFAAHAGSHRDLENAQDNYDRMVAELQRAEQKAKLLMATAGSSGAVSQTFALQSPIDGEVVARSINPGVEVQGQYSGGATVELFTIGKLDDVWIIADVYEQDIARVKIGAPVLFKLVAYPGQVFKGEVDWVSGTLDPATRTGKVRCVLSNMKGQLKPEMYATAEIQTDGHKAIAIPRSSLLHLGDKTLVMAVDSSKKNYERRPVIVDEDETGEWVPVLHGLEPGENVVTEGALILSEAGN